jgi:hypothetical protein
VEPAEPDGWLEPAEPTDWLPECWGEGDDWESFAKAWSAWRPDEKLSDREFWEHAAEFVKGWMANKKPAIRTAGPGDP